MHSTIYKRDKDEKVVTYFPSSDEKSGASYISEKSASPADSDKASSNKVEPKRFYSRDKRDKGVDHMYYPPCHMLTDSKQKQESYAHSQQLYQRKDRVVGTAVPHGRMYPVTVETEIETALPPQEQSVPPPDYDSLPPPYTPQ